MTSSAEPELRYIITEKTLLGMEALAGKLPFPWGQMELANIQKEIRQHPYNTDTSAQQRIADIPTDTLLKELKRRYRSEPIILDFVENIECELIALLREVQP